MTGISSVTIPEILRQRAGMSPDRVAMRSVDGACWTFADIEAVSIGIAGRLRGESAGQRYGIVMANGPTLTLTILGACCAGTAVPLNPAYQRDEFREYFLRLGVCLVVIDHDRPEAEAAACDLGLPVVRVSGDERGMAGGLSQEPGADETALVLMTSGSTGKPKLVPLSHRNLCVSAVQVAESLGLTENDVCLSMWELHHIGGLVDLLLAPIVSGGSIISTSGFDSPLFFRCLFDYRPTWFQAVPTALHEIVSALRRGVQVTDGHGLRLLRSVAAKLPEELQSELEDRFGVPVIQTFGMTEAGPLITSTLLPPAERKRGSVGASCGCEIRVLDGAGGTAAAGVNGEIAIRGDNVFAGYEGEDEENRARFRGGWFLTGDLGWLDADGHLFLAGRSKQLINRGGEKINPLEVEDVLKTHPAVADAAAFALEHRTLGEDVAAAVILKPGARCKRSELKELVASRLAAFKVPRRILFLDAFPLTGIGKLDRPELARIAAAMRTDQPATEELDAIERQLAAIWAREMNLESIGAEENFFVAGGDSLMGVRVLLEVEKWSGQPLPAELMMEITTVRDMAAKLREHGLKSAGPAAEPACPLIHEMTMVMGAGRIPAIGDAPTLKARRSHRDKGNRPPIYWCFNSPDREMFRLLRVWDSKTRIIGLYSGGDGAEEVTAAVAEHYCELILERRAGRPFFLAGNCRGGRVAEHMLARFRAAGVAPLGVVLMEHAPEEPGVVEVPHLMLIGESTWVPPKRQKVWRKLARQSDDLVRVAEIRGSHNRFFRRENVESVQSAVRDFIETIPTT